MGRYSKAITCRVLQFAASQPVCTFVLVRRSKPFHIAYLSPADTALLNPLLILAQISHTRMVE